MRKSILLIGATVFIFFACQRQVSGPQNRTVTDSLYDESISDATATPICFEGEVLPIFQTNCAKSGCHNTTSHKEGYIFDNYKDIMRRGVVPYHPYSSEVYEVLAEGEMPPRGYPRLSSTQITTIRRWIKQGAKNTRNCTTCDVSKYTYAAIIAPILQAHCTGCHTGATASAGVDLSIYSGVRTVALNGMLVGTITHAAGYPAMPLNQPMLSDCNITQVEKWVAAGALNN